MYKPRDKTVTIGGASTYEGQLPLPVVHYPGYFGTFHGYSAENDESIIFCECAKRAIVNCLTLNYELRIFRRAGDRTFVSERNFPQNFSERFYTNSQPTLNDVIDQLKFRSKICHKCNLVVPKYRYCHENYGGVFRQHFGWYIDQRLFDFGIDPDGFHFAPDSFPYYVISVFKDASDEYQSEFGALFGSKPFSIKCATFEHQEIIKEVRRIAENEIRLEYGFKKMRSDHVSQRILLYIVRSLYPFEQILYRTRPNFLKGLELDIYVPNQRVAFEYQGVQHFKAVNHWGGDETLQLTKKRDDRKKRICKKNGITLIEVNHKDVVSKELLEWKLSKKISNVLFHSDPALRAGSVVSDASCSAAPVR